MICIIIKKRNKEEKEKINVLNINSTKQPNTVYSLNKSITGNFISALTGKSVNIINIYTYIYIYSII